MNYVIELHVINYYQTLTIHQELMGAAAYMHRQTLHV